MKPISRFEKMAQRLVEGSLSRLFGGRLELAELATHLAHAMEDAHQDGVAVARYELALAPDDYAELLTEHEALESRLADYVRRLAQQGGVVLREEPRVMIVPDPSLNARQIVVRPRNEQDDTGERTGIWQGGVGHTGPLSVMKAVDAFLIIGGRRHYQIAKPVINIGRRASNDIVLDAAAVSRQHAQLRWRLGRFVLFDLDSRSGISVNGQVVTECTLQPGDIIDICGETLIYGEGVDGGELPRSQDTDSYSRPFDDLVE